tara:strand:+ start:653 stop:928 length:276 start_codon:yes stop_codon:yes gene_type:complete
MPYLNKKHPLMRMEPDKGFNVLSREDVALLNPVEFMGLYIWMALVAPDTEKLRMALGEAERIAKGLTENEVRRGKVIALDMHEHHGIDTLD